MKTIDIKGKEYVMVHERIKYFRENYPDHTLLTEFIKLTEEWCVCKATVTRVLSDERYLPVSTGHAYEKADSNYINKTSYIENCETSAVGRALGNFGIGIDTSVASAEEVQNAIKQQGQPKKEEQQSPKLATKEQVQEIRKIGATQQLVEDEVVKLVEFVKDKMSEYSLNGNLTSDGAQYIIKNFETVLEEYNTEKSLV